VPYPPHKCQESTISAYPSLTKGTFLLCQPGGHFCFGLTGVKIANWDNLYPEVIVILDPRLSHLHCHTS
jgi:hypothetical protein